MTCDVQPLTVDYRHHRISESILTLRAALELGERLSTRQSQEDITESDRLREVVGDIGLVLLNPLEQSFSDEEWRKSTRDSRCDLTAIQVEEPGDDDSSQILSEPLRCPIDDSGFDRRSGGPSLTESSDSSFSNESAEDFSDCIFDYEIGPVRVEPPDDSSELDLAPRILDGKMFQQIVDEALPGNLRIYKWKRIFSIAKDGDLLFSMMEKCCNFKHTLFVLRTGKGNILGGFASEHWKAQNGFEKRKAYYGTGTCFLFSDYPEPSSPDKKLNIYKWSGANEYCQLCDPENGTIAMGGGDGDFGVIIENGFLQGSSGRCSTFDNPPLIPGIDGRFDIVDFEVYGMMPLIPTVLHQPSLKYSRHSLLRSQS